MRGRMCVGYMQTLCAILYKGLEHLWILVSRVGPGTNPLQILREDCIRMFIAPLFIKSKLERTQMSNSNRIE